MGAARVVGLGESTHGTQEFFQLKARLLEYLVQVEGFRVFAIEANQLATERVNRYVEGGAGTARDVMRVMFRVWNTEEMEQLVEWIRSFNAEHPDKRVRFVGYDMQDQRTPADTLRAFLARVEPSFVARFDSLAGEYQAQKSYATPQVADTTRARWFDQSTDALGQRERTPNRMARARRERRRQRRRRVGGAGGQPVSPGGEVQRHAQLTGARQPDGGQPRLDAADDSAG